MYRRSRCCAHETCNAQVRLLQAVQSISVECGQSGTTTHIHSNLEIESKYYVYFQNVYNYRCA